MFSQIEFDEPFFDDIEPEPKFTEEILFLLLDSVSGGSSNLRKYNDREIYSAVRHLIEHGFLRGTIIDGSRCTWSRLTYRGKVLKFHLQEVMLMKGIQ